MASRSSVAPPVSFSSAFERLRDTVTKDEARTFSSTSMRDVWSTSKDVERYLESRRKLRGLHRIRPFLEGIEKYSKAVDVLCNGTPYLPYIWAPIKLLLQIAQDHISALERLIDAYAMIGEAMPRFDRLSTAFREDPEFQQVLGYFYEDILEFHRRAYKYFRRRAWKTVFDSLWKTFNPRFQGILENLRKHRDLVDQEANALNIAEEKAWRTQQLEQMRQSRVERAEEIERVENQRIISQTREAIAWFGAAEDQEDLLLKLSRSCDGNDDHWVLKEPTIMRWLEPAESHAFVWLNGKPGAGKSVICSKIIEHLQDAEGQVVIYYFCSNHQILQRPANDILRSFACQLLVANTGLAPYILETFVNHGLRPNKKSLGAILEKLITSLPWVRIVVDGVDECPQSDQDEIIDDLLRIRGPVTGACKTLLSSRKLPSILNMLHMKPTLRLDEKYESVNLTISSFIRPRLEKLRQKFDSEIIGELGRQIVAKANGMFLWVKLIMGLIEDLHYAVHLQEAMDMLPEGLPALYARIVSHICGDAKTPNQRMAVRILQWMIVAQRPLRRYELESGIILDERVSRITSTSKARGDVLSLCSPILDVEDGPGGYVSFVHFTAKEFLQNFYDSPIIKKSQAQLTVSLSCVLYLTSSLDLVNPCIADDEKRSQVALCLHELHLYVNDHWLDHLRALVKTSERPIAQGQPLSPLRCSLDTLAHVHNELLPSEYHNTGGDHEPISPEEVRWETLGISPAAQSLLNQALIYRHNVSATGGLLANDNGGAVDNQDPSLFTSIRKQYLGIVEDLLGPQESEGACLDNFRARHLSGAFFCRYRNCSRATQGFNAPELREAHEESHLPQFRCTEPQCGFLGWKCNTRRALKKHVAQYHDQHNVSTIPSALRRTSRNLPQDRSLFRFRSPSPSHGWRSSKTAEDSTLAATDANLDRLRFQHNEGTPEVMPHPRLYLSPKISPLYAQAEQSLPMSAQQQPFQYQEAVQETENEERPNMMQGRTAPEPFDSEQWLSDTGNSAETETQGYTPYSANPAYLDLPSMPLASQLPASDHTKLQDYQTQMMLLEQQNKGRLLRARQEHNTTEPPSPPPIPHTPEDYQIQLMLLEQQNKKLLLMASQEQDTIKPPSRPPNPHALQDYQMALMLLEQKKKKERLLMARQEPDNASRSTK